MSKVLVKKRDAEKVLASIKKVYRAWLEDASEDMRPKLVKDWDWLGTGPAPYAIVWEGGPYEWTFLIHGGRDEEFGVKVEAVQVPESVFAEPITSWALGLYPN